MHVEVTEKNIDRYKLVELTGNSREAMLSAAADARVNGHTFSCNVPEAWIETHAVETENVFDIYESEVVDPQRLTHCGYEEREDTEGEKYQVCVLHGKTSRHDLVAHPTAPCLLMDPYPADVVEAMRTLAEKKTEAPKLGSICTYAKKEDPVKGTLYICKVHGRPSKHDISRLPNQPCLSADPYSGFEEVTT